MRFPPFFLVAALALFAAACAPREGGGTIATPTPIQVAVEAEALSPYAIEVRWTTTEETISPVVFSDGSGDDTIADDELETEHRVLLQMLEPATTYEIRVGDDTGFTGTISETTPASPGGPFQVLFDAAHGEDAGNADWVIDDNFPAPSPASDPDHDKAGGRRSRS